MAAYLAWRIELGKISYKRAIKAYPQFKEDIDAILIADGREDLIVD